MKKPRKLRVDTEAAARKAEKFLLSLNVNDHPSIENFCYIWRKENEIRIRIISGASTIFDVPFSWLYKKRAPLTGVTKRLKKAIRKPKGKK